MADTGVPGPTSHDPGHENLESQQTRENEAVSLYTEEADTAPATSECPAEPQSRTPSKTVPDKDVNMLSNPVLVMFGVQSCLVMFLGVALNQNNVLVALFGGLVMLMSCGFFIESTAHQVVRMNRCLRQVVNEYKMQNTNDGQNASQENIETPPSEGVLDPTIEAPTSRSTERNHDTEGHQAVSPIELASLSPTKALPCPGQRDIDGTDEQSPFINTANTTEPTRPEDDGRFYTPGRQDTEADLGLDNGINATTGF